MVVMAEILLLYQIGKVLFRLEQEKAMQITPLTLVKMLV